MTASSLSARVRRGILLVASAWFVLPEQASTNATIVATAITALSLFALVSDVPRKRLAILAGAMASISFLFSSRVWLATCFVGVPLLATFAMADTAPARDHRRRVALWSLGVPLFVGAAISALLVALGMGVVTELTWSNALPREPIEVGIVTLARTAIVIATWRAREASRSVALAAGGVLATLIAVRLFYVMSLARLDQELFWSEAPALTNALKLARGATLYGPPSELDSYSYSPLIDLAHRALLVPFGLELELFAHRVLVLVAQLGAALVALWAVRPRHFGSGAIIVLVAFSNLLAPAIHPDHALLLCMASAIAVTCAGDRMPRAVRDVALLLVTPIAVACKLSGAGLGIALALGALRRKSTRDIVILAASGVLSLLTVPLFDRTLGRFSFYAIALQRSHPMEWRHFVEPPWPSYGAFALVATTFVITCVHLAQIDEAEKRRIDGVLAIALAMGVTSLPAAAKYAGRDNNLTPLVFGLGVALAMTANALPMRAVTAWALVAWGQLTTNTFTRPFPSALAPVAAYATRAAAEVVRADAAAGERTLVPMTTLPFIRAGVPGLPGPRYHSAIELFYGGHDEWRAFERALTSGEYRTVILPSGAFAPRAGPAAAFQAAVARALAARYDEGAPTQEFPGLRVYRRRAP